MLRVVSLMRWTKKWEAVQASGDDRKAAYRSGPAYARMVRRESSLTVVGLGLDALLPKPKGR